MAGYELDTEITNQATKALEDVAQGLDDTASRHLPIVHTFTDRVNAEADGHPASSTSDIRGKLAPMMAQIEDHVGSALRSASANTRASYQNAGDARNTGISTDEDNEQRLRRAGEGLNGAPPSVATPPITAALAAQAAQNSANQSGAPDTR